MKRTTYTKAPTVQEKKQALFVVDVKKKIVGRCATKIAHLLQGKDKVGYAKNADMGDVVIVINGSKAILSGKKAASKEYETYTGYPGGLNAETFDSLIKRNPEMVMRRAVRGMLPKNKLRDVAMARLFVFPEESYTIVEQYKGLLIEKVSL